MIIVRKALNERRHFGSVPEVDKPDPHVKDVLPKKLKVRLCFALFRIHF